MLVITDERMPEMSGSQLIREVRAIRRAIPILLVSGYLGGMVTRRAYNEGADEVLKRPSRSGIWLRVWRANLQAMIALRRPLPARVFTSALAATYPTEFEGASTPEHRKLGVNRLGMSGFSSIREVRDIRQDLPILLMSGYVGSGLIKDAREAGRTMY